nr:universal stress protein [uncultured Psychroserpens sp.]
MNKKYKILVLSDLKETTTSTLKSAVSLTKMVDGDLHFFHVKKPTEVVERENQLSAMRTINRTYLTIENEIKDIIEPIANDYEVKISHSQAIGNIKSAINDCIKSYKPDIIILGKRKSKLLNFIGDNVIDHVVKNYNGDVLIASEENPLEPNKEISLGVLDGLKTTTLSAGLGSTLLNYTQKPVKSFKTQFVETEFENSTLTANEIVELVFDHGDKSIQSLSNYLRRSDVNLLCLDRGDKEKANSNIDIKNVINNVSVSLLISGNSLSYS